MLWEETDPVETLTKRFGFARPEGAAVWVGDALKRHWGLDVAACDRLVISGWNVLAWVETDDRRLIAKWSAIPPRFSRLRRSAQITEWLHAQGVPVAAPIPARDGTRMVSVANPTRPAPLALVPLPGSRFLLGVLPVLAGELLDVDDPAQVDDAGRALAAVHEALAAYPDRRRSREGAQLVHNDFRSANVLHDGTRITAILDLEEVTYATRASDLAKAAVFLGTRYRGWGPVTEEVRGAFVAAYQERAPLTPAELRTVDARIAAEMARQGWS